MAGRSPGSETLRLGILGAARIAPKAVVAPATRIPAVDVVAVAARQGTRAREFARAHRLPRAHEGYDALLADDTVDAVYVPTPNGLHGRWTLAALHAGKHVLCEKPFTANSAEARGIADAARGGSTVVMEAFHHRYHPLMLRARQIVDSGEIGPLRRVDAAICFPVHRHSDIRYDSTLAGGSMMDAGCYAAHLARFLGRSDIDGEPTVTSARAKLRAPAIDRAMRASLEFPSGHTARLRCSLWSAELLRLSVRVLGEHGEMKVYNPIAPQLFNRLSVQVGGNHRVEHFARLSGYAYQLDAFAGSVLHGHRVPTGPDDAVANMGLVDTVYRVAGLPPREPA